MENSQSGQESQCYARQQPWSPRGDAVVQVWLLGAEAAKHLAGTVGEEQDRVAAACIGEGRQLDGFGSPRA